MRWSQGSQFRYRIGLAAVWLITTVIIVAAFTSCTPRDATGPELSRATAPAPPGLVSVGLAGTAHQFWPYTGADLTGTPQDPINLVFIGRADPRAIRDALLGLDGDRTAFGMPPVYPFNCLWSDAIGDVQVSYAAPTQWIGSAVQLQCGNFGPVRFHLRLFAAGGTTFANAHFELLIPGTADHQVLSWEFAEQLVTLDMRRTGLLDQATPLGTTGPINAAPFRSIPPEIYNLLPADLTALLGGPAAPVGAPVPIGSDGAATIINIAGRAGPVLGERSQSFTIDYGQIVPKPFCAAGPSDLVRVDGPVTLRKSVRLSASGELTSEFHASGRLDVTPIDPTTGVAAAATYAAQVQEEQTSAMDDRGSRARARVLRIELPAGATTHGRLSVALDVNADGTADFRRGETCNP